MKKLVVLLFCSVIYQNCIAQVISFPPELHWWINEIKIIDPSITLSKFAKTKEFEEPLLVPEKARYSLYPVFFRWNFSGNKIASFFYGVQLGRAADGRYSFLDNKIRQFIIMNKDLKIIYYGKERYLDHVNGLAWLKDDELVTVSTDRYGVDTHIIGFTFIIRKYTLHPKKIVVNQFEYNIEIDAEEYGLFKPKIEWTENRPDYFIE